MDRKPHHEVYHPTHGSDPYQPRKRPRRFHFKPVRTVFTCIGIIAVLVALARYCIVPVLVLLAGG